MPNSKRRVFPTSREDAKAAAKQLDSRFSQSPAYSLAFQDTDFLLRPELRPIRLQLELLKPELMLNELNIESTVVMYGSARTLPSKKAKAKLEAVEKRLADEEPSDELKTLHRIAKRDLEMSRYYDEARKLGALISSNTHEDKMVVITGGGPGIMEAANRGAHDVEGQSIGMNIVLPFEQQPNPYITPELCFQFHYFAVRKMHLLMRAKSMVAFPGGFGTMDELFEALTLIQTKKIKPIPVLLFGRKFWNRVIDFDVLVEQGTISPKDINLFQYVETAEEAWQVIKTANQLDPILLA